jgi:hypothetical protein
LQVEWGSVRCGIACLGFIKYKVCPQQWLKSFTEWKPEKAQNLVKAFLLDIMFIILISRIAVADLARFKGTNDCIVPSGSDVVISLRQ